MIKTGDWARARRALVGSSRRLKVAIGTALRQEAHDLRKQIVRGITKQAPAGKAFKPLSPLTIAARKRLGFKGTKALMMRGDLRNAISAIVKGDTAFIGVPRKARGKDGEDLVDIAKLNEFGSDPIVIPISPKMRRFLFALLRDAGKTPSGGVRQGVVVVRLPARPFLGPVFDKWKKGVRKRFLGRISKMMRLGGI